MAGVDLVPRVSLTSTTVAPGMTAPDGSFTVPDTVPVVICAGAGTAAASNIDAATTIDNLIFVIDLSLQRHRLVAQTPSTCHSNAARVLSLARKLVKHIMKTITIAQFMSL